MATPSPANALPRFSVCRLMNNDWVNSRLDGTRGTQPSSQVEKKRDEMKTLRDKRWDFALEIKVKLNCLSPRILLSPSVFSLFVFASLHTPDSSPTFSHTFPRSYLIPTIPHSVSLPPLLAYLSRLIHLSLSLLRNTFPSPSNTPSAFFSAKLPWLVCQDLHVPRVKCISLQSYRLLRFLLWAGLF